jgi:hypothetical protein
MVELAISIKHKLIAREWCYIYEIICENVLTYEGQDKDFIPAYARRNWEDKILETLMNRLE